MREQTYVLTVALVAAFGGLLFGYDTGVMAGALLFLSPEFGLTAYQEGLVTSALLAGAALGAVGSGSVAAALGRRRTLILGGVIFVGASVGCAAATGVTSMTLARLVLGLAVGMVSIVVPMYISEMSPARLRGRMVSLNTLMIVVGQLAAYVVNSALASGGNWRLMLGLAAVPGVVLALGMFFLPDTPAWYAARGRIDAARRTAERAGVTLAELGVAEPEGRGLKSERRGARAQWGRLRGERWLVAAVGVAVVVGVIQQITGVNAVVYFAPTMMNSVGIPVESSVHTSLVIGVVSVISCYVGLRIVDRVGRKRLLCLGLMGNVCALVGLAVAYSFASEYAAAAWISLAMMAFFMVSQQAAVSLTTWLLISELVPLPVRGVGMGAAGLALWLANWAVAQFFLPLVEAVSGQGAFLIFAALGLVALWFVRRCVPETAGLSLDEVGEGFQRRFGGAAGVR
ncbi:MULTISPECIES: sugar porter family MFS transporter [unclassified Corynebacterium]|uniref:sugar porter family MFS transporter n=1 Tax=unclassified Corynebacterium TaxID=2624378 RepID=UPI0029C9B97F|nr:MULTISPECIES: sugar porter family MFS transporter [unclassified Corynebacterium]WPF65730.1 sugar porter family MFS transporter [Corynebacterium sp. 22KM0430]WPF68225.1 sugar porter family MFS transporter [Corynebacterium sp. 21KM1197]